MTHAATHAPLRLAGVVGRLATVQLIVANIGIITGPLVAQALGATGRGLLATIRAPLTLAPVLASFGLGRYRGLLGDRINRRLGVT